MPDDLELNTCPNCGGQMRIMISVTIAANADKIMNISKKSLRDKDVELWGVYWNNMQIWCTGSCGRQFRGIQISEPNTRMAQALMGIMATSKEPETVEACREALVNVNQDTADSLKEGRDAKA